MVFFSPFFRVNLTYLRIEIDEKLAQYIIDGRDKYLRVSIDNIKIHIMGY